jgi:hypothetical protein
MHGVSFQIGPGEFVTIPYPAEIITAAQGAAMKTHSLQIASPGGVLYDW